MFTVEVDWEHLVFAAIPLVVLAGLKFLLDLRLANLVVKYLFWLPVRNYFREKPVDLRGEWEHQWDSGGSLSFIDDTARHGFASLRQWGSYCYAEFYSKGKRYAFFGSIRGSYIVGDWYDVNDSNGYFGVFQLEILTSSSLRGLWLGHSKTSKEIRCDKSIWTKVN